MISENTCWDIIGDNFKKHGFVEHQTESFNNFIEFGVNKILTEEPPINIKNNNEDNLYNEFTLEFGDVYIPQPTMTEEHRMLRSFTPNEARLRDLNYDSPIYCSITTTLKVDGYPDEVEKNVRVVIGRIPIMLRTSKCYLTQMSKEERIKAGECEYDEGGYFIIRGKERVLIPQLRGMYNVPKVLYLKKGEKFKIAAEVRSMSDDTGHSALVKCLLSQDERTVSFKIPYIKDVIPAGIIFKAYGFIDKEDFSNLIGLKDNEKIQKYIKYIDRDSYFCNFEKSNIPKNIPIVDHDKYVRQKTIENAYKYIGQFTIHTIKDSEKGPYAKQVVLNELFPHLGVSASAKEKALFCGLLINKLLTTHMGLRSPDDRDDYINKRVEPAGVLCYELLKQLFKKFIQAIVNTIEKKKQIPDALGIISRLPVITNGLKHCFSTGNWGVPKNAYIRTGVSQVLSRLSYGATLSNLRRLTIPVGKESKNTKIRQIHPSQIMYICPSECFEPNIEVLMWDGSIKYGKDIKVGDTLIDDKGRPVKVKSICSGVSKMYDIVPTKSNFSKHKVTDNHILTLKIRNHGSIVTANRTDRSYRFIVTYFDRNTLIYRSSHFYTLEEAELFAAPLLQDDTLDITVKNYLKLSTYTQEKLVLYKVNYIDWSKNITEIDPYIYGMWLSKGKNNTIRFNKESDEKIMKFITDLEYELELIDKNCYAVMKNNANILDEFLVNNEITSKIIPAKFIASSYDFRMKLLAGFVDGSGSVRKYNKNEIRINGVNIDLFNNIYTISMSLGFSTNIRKTSTNTRELTITGVDTCKIPSVNTEKILRPINNQLRAKSFLGTRFVVKESDESEFVGWQLDDNNKGRFLHKSGLVLHNTPEGAPIGIVLNFSLLTKISEKFPTLLIKEILKDSKNIIYVDDIMPDNQYCKVIVNGFICGITINIDNFIEEFKSYRENDIIPYDVSINYNKLENEINIFSDEGRLLRPVFTVDGDKLKLTKEDGTNWDELVEKNRIVYLDNNEIQTKVIAFNQNELKKYKCDFCEIAPAMMLGVMGSIIPWPDHNQSPRNCYQAAMGKQAMSMFALTHLIRCDTVSHVLNYPQKPLVSTRAADMMGFTDMPAGINAIVAIACYTGYNQEDSIILNKGSIERGMFWATTFNTHSEEDKKQGTYMSDKISLPPLDKRRKDLNYSLLDEHGIIRKTLPNSKNGSSVYVQAGDVIIGKCIIHNNKNSEQTIIDNSLFIKKGEEGFINKVLISTTPNGYKSVKIIIRKVREPQIGDKFASRSAQKGTTGTILPNEDMPFTANGITPDIIMNPHAIPSRMTINQLMESVLGKSCAIEGDIGDATAFTKNSVNIAEKLCERLKMNRYDGQGTELLYNGMTGEPMGLVFIGPVYYQRLKHLVVDKMHARAYGPNATLTRQPLEGRSRDGGLRMGEMERDCTIAHGSSVFLKERLGDQSDPYNATVCDLCGNITSSPNECKGCGTDRVTSINLPYVSKLVIQELNSMLIKCKINVK
jgi:DNA-directed RNA polymerase beta subunit